MTTDQNDDFTEWFQATDRLLEPDADAFAENIMRKVHRRTIRRRVFLALATAGGAVFAALQVPDIMVILNSMLGLDASVAADTVTLFDAHADIDFRWLGALLAGLIAMFATLTTSTV